MTDAQSVIGHGYRTKNIKSRLVKNLGANAFGQLVTFVIQITGVPIFLKYWGNQLYGEWLILSAIPAYLSMSDLGFASVAANDMTMKMAANDREGVYRIFQSTWVFVSVISFTFAALGYAAVNLLPIEQWLNISLLSQQDTQTIIGVLAVQVSLALQCGVIWAAFRCAGLYAFGTLLINFLRLLDFLATVSAVILGASVVQTALVATAARLVGTILIYGILRYRISGLKLGVRHARWIEIRRLAGPAIAFMAFPLGNALGLQGLVLVIGSVLGPVAVVTFSTLRTLSRVALQGMNMINNAVWPEFSTAFGAGDMKLARTLHCRSCQVSFILSIGVVTILNFAGEWIINHWTHGKIVFERSLFYLLLSVIFANSFWYTSSVVAIATNRHQGIAVAYLLGTVVSLLLCHYLLTEIWLSGAAMALFSVDLFMCIVVLRTSLSLLEQSWWCFMKGIFKLH